MRPAACLHLAAAALLLGGCSESTQPLPPAPTPLAATSTKARAESRITATFKIPRRRGVRGPRYLSPSTASIVLAVFNSTHTKRLTQKEVDTVPGLNGCTAVSDGSFTCPISLTILPGAYAFDVAAFDEFGGKGNEVSALKDYAKKVVAGKANSLRFTLFGIPAQVTYQFAGTSPLVHGNGTSTVDIAGVGTAAAQRLTLAAVDAQDNIIVGSGAPVFAVATNQTSNLSIAHVAGTTNQYALTPRHVTTTAMTITVEAIPGGNVAAPIYAKASLSIVPLLYIGNSGGTNTVTAYAPWSGGAPIYTIPSTSGIANPYAMALDAAGNLYVANFTLSGTVLVFPPGGTTSSRTISGLLAPIGLAVDASGDVFETEYISQEVKEFTPSGGNTASRALSSSTSPTGIDKPAGVAVDASGNLYVANNAGTIGVSVYAPGTSTTPKAVFHSGMTTPAQLAFDASGNLYVANNGASSVTEYGPPFSNSSTAIRTFSSANTATPYAVAVDKSNNVWVGQASGGNVVEFAPNATVHQTIPGFTSAVYGIATDASGNAYVTDNGSNAVVEFPPSGSPTVYTTGVSSPTSVIVLQ